MTGQNKLKDIENVQLNENISNHSNITADDTVSLYLNEMDRVPLLTREEEVSLAKTIIAGRHAREKMLDTNSNNGEFIALQKIVKEGQQARDHLIQANIRLVVSIAKKYRRYSSSFLDLIQAGNVGLIRAVDKFDHTMGNRFSTYATWWIRRSVLRHINQKERTIRIPDYLTIKIRNLIRIRKELTEKLSRNPTAEEIGQVGEMPSDEVERLLSYEQHTLSLEQPVGREGDMELQNYIENQNAPNPFIEVKQSLILDDLLDAFKELDEREAKILTLRFGLNGERQHTLKELGELFGITRERIRQIQKCALRKLRHPCVHKKLQTDY